MREMLKKLKQNAKRLKINIFTLYLASHDPRTPRCVKFLLVGIVAYAVSPVDLIPDFIPILGYLDDLILLPLGVILAIKLIPAPVLADCRRRAIKMSGYRIPQKKAASILIIGVWMVITAFCIAWVYGM